MPRAPHSPSSIGHEDESRQVPPFIHGSLAHSSISTSQTPLCATPHCDSLTTGDVVHTLCRKKSISMTYCSLLVSASVQSPFAHPDAHRQEKTPIGTSASVVESEQTAPFRQGALKHSSTSSVHRVPSQPCAHWQAKLSSSGRYMHPKCPGIIPTGSQTVSLTTVQLDAESRHVAAF